METECNDSSTKSDVELPPFLSSQSPGFRFAPTDEELVVFYLKRKVSGKLGDIDVIPELDIFNYEPWDLPGLSRLKTPDPLWYFFIKINGYPNVRINRTTKAGYWKPTGKDRHVNYECRVIGRKKTLVYHSGRAPRGERTDWVMHEYKLTDERLEKPRVQQDAFVLCKIFKKSGLDPAQLPKGEWLEDENEVAMSETTNELSADVKFPQVVRWEYQKDLEFDIEDLLCYQGNDLDEEQQASISTIHHDDTNSTVLENQDSEEKSLGKQTLEHDLQSICFAQLESLPKEILLHLGEGYEFEKDMLIQLWMAMGFLMEEATGANYFEKLVSEGYISRSVANSLYTVNTGKLNTEFDDVRERQSCIIMGTGSQIDDASTEVLHVFVLCDEIDETIFKKLRRFSKLRTLLFLRSYGPKLQQVPRDLFMCYESLVALDLSGTHIKELPSSTRKMIHLRYLDLSWTFIELLPERIDRFQRLQTLKLRGCSYLCRLPKTMKRLTELRHLDLDVLRQLTVFPSGMGALVNLQTLSAFPLGTEDGLQISELKYLNNLTGKFCIANLENVQSAEKAKEASLIAKRSIKKLELRWSRHYSRGPKNEDEAILENLCPHSDLEDIQILCYHGTGIPSWFSYLWFHKLVRISLQKCENVVMLPSLEKLPSLKSLELVGLNSVIEMNCGGEVDQVAFPKLQKLAIDGMLTLETWTKAQEGAYPSLAELSIKDCPKLTELPSFFYLPSLKHLEISGCDKLAFISEKPLSASIQQLIVEDCPLIEERCSKLEGLDWYKIQHIPTIWIDQVAIQPSEEDDELDW